MCVPFGAGVGSERRPRFGSRFCSEERLDFRSCQPFSPLVRRRCQMGHTRKCGRIARSGSWHWLRITPQGPPGSCSPGMTTTILQALSALVVAERFGTRRLLTFDHRHFRVLRPLGGGQLKLLPANGRPRSWRCLGRELVERRRWPTGRRAGLIRGRLTARTGCRRCWAQMLRRTRGPWRAAPASRCSARGQRRTGRAPAGRRRPEGSGARTTAR